MEEHTKEGEGKEAAAAGGLLLTPYLSPGAGRGIVLLPCEAVSRALGEAGRSFLIEGGGIYDELRVSWDCGEADIIKRALALVEVRGVTEAPSADTEDTRPRWKYYLTPGLYAFSVAKKEPSKAAFVFTEFGTRRIAMPPELWAELSAEPK